LQWAENDCIKYTIWVTFVNVIWLTDLPG
jgi:hypothetical protein